MLKNRKKIYITGYGICSALGIGKEINQEKIFLEKSCITQQTMKYKDKDVTSYFGAVCDDLPDDEFFSKNGIEPDRAMKLAVLAADEAVEQSGVLKSEFDPLRAGVIVGSSLGGMLSGNKFHSDWLTKGIEHTDAELIKQYPLHAMSDIITKKYNLNGTKMVISTACSSGLNAMGLASDLICDDRCDFVIVGGVDPLSEFSFAGFKALGAVDEGICHPYSSSHGINIGEGSAFFILESEESVKRRNASKICEFRGYGLSGDAYHPTAPDINGNGAFRSMTSALENSGLDISDVGYINGHGTGTPANDNAERKAWKRITDENTDIPMISNKGTTGHCLGAAGAIELAFSVMSLEKGMIPPTVNFEKENDEIINFVPNNAVKKDLKNVLSNSFAFGGINCSAIVSSAENDEVSVETDDVVITGIGCVGAGGNDINEFFSRLSEGKTAVGKIDTDGKDFRCPYAGLADVDDKFFKKFIPSAKLRRLDRITKFAMTSGRQSLLDSRLMVTPKNAGRIGVIYGTGSGPSSTIKEISEQIINVGISGVSSEQFPNSVLNAAPGHFSIANNLKGVTSTISSGNTSGLNALIYASMLLKNNQADAIVVISADEWDETIQVGNERLDLLSKNGRLPFSENADGVILSEGSVAFVLERKQHALSRNARIYAKIEEYFSVSGTPELSGFDYEGSQWKDAFRDSMTRSGKNIDFYASTSYGGLKIDSQDFDIAQSLFPDAEMFSVPRLIGTPCGSVGTYGLLSCIYTLENQKTPYIGEPSDLAEKYRQKLTGSGKEGSFRCAATSVSAFGGAYAGVIVSKDI